MARVTVEDSLEKAKNRFALTHLTTLRTKQLLKNARPLSEKKNNREIVTALREIAEGKVAYVHPEILDMDPIEIKMAQLTDDTNHTNEDADSEKMP